MGWWNAIWRTKTKDWTVGQLSPGNVAAPWGARRTIAPDTGYLDIMLRRMRIPYAREGWKANACAAHCFAQLIYGRDVADIHAIATPVKLLELAPSGSANIEMGADRFVGPIAYRGGDLVLELGLFVTKTDLLLPYLGLLGKVSGLAPAPAAKIADLVRDGIARLGADKTCSLEIGLANTFSEVQTGCYVLVAETAIPLAELTVDEAGTLYRQGAPVESPYLVYSIEATARRADWRRLPDIADVYEAFQGWLRVNDPARAQETFTAFKSRALLSKDLLESDATKIIADVQAQFDAVVRATRPVLESLEANVVVGKAVPGNEPASPIFAD